MGWAGSCSLGTLWSVDTLDLDQGGVWVAVALAALVAEVLGPKNPSIRCSVVCAVLSPMNPQISMLLNIGRKPGSYRSRGIFEVAIWIGWCYLLDVD